MSYLILELPYTKRTHHHICYTRFLCTVNKWIPSSAAAECTASAGDGENDVSYMRNTKQPMMCVCGGMCARNAHIVICIHTLKKGEKKERTRLHKLYGLNALWNCTRKEHNALHSTPLHYTQLPRTQAVTPTHTANGAYRHRVHKHMLNIYCASLSLLSVV